MSQPKLPQQAPAAAAAKKQGYPFWLGGAAAASAASITHPLDATKYRLQTMAVKQGMLKTMVDSAKNEGILTLWWGLTATWLRQASYSITRFAVYEEAKRTVSPGATPTPLQLAGCAAVAGGIAGAVGNPAEIVLTRMCSDLNKPAEARYNYGNAVRGLYKVVADEGATTLARGLGPNVMRSVVMNVGQMAGYDASKQFLQKVTGMKEGPQLQTAASFMAGTMAQTIVNPIDVIKARVQNSATKVSVGSVITNSLKQDGPIVFLRGWLPAWLRLQPQTTLLFLFFEQFKSIIDKSREAKANKEHKHVV